MKLKDVPNLAEYLPDDTNLESDINAPVLPHPYVAGEKISALSWAASKNLSGVVKILIDAGANPNVLETSSQAMENGKTPLFFTNSPSITRLLTQAGARLNIAVDGKNVFEYHLSFVDRQNQSVWRNVHTLSPDGSMNVCNTELLAAAYQQFFQPSAELVDRLLELTLNFTAIKAVNQLIAEYATTISLNDISNDFASQPRNIKKQFETFCSDSVKLITKAKRLDKLAEVTAGLSDADVEQVVTQFNVRKRENLLTAYNAQQAAVSAASTATAAPTAVVAVVTEPAQALAVTVAGAVAHKPL
jgi:hypothetical protein